jgi:hypothetical protein
VAFYSAASNLVSEDTNGVWDVFLRDTLMGTTTRLSVDSNGMQGNFDSSSPSISTDGRFVAFRSLASNLVSGDTNGTWDIFLRDMLTHTTTRISVDSNRVEGNNASEFPAISANGRYVAFGSYASNLVSGDTNNMPDIFLRDTQTSTTKRISVSSSGTQGNSYSYSPSISADGRYVTFYSYASNLVSGDTNAMWDVIVRDTQMDTTMRASVNSSGVEGNLGSDFPSISADGRYVAFSSAASNLVDGDSKGTQDIFVRDTQTNTTMRLSVDSSGIQGNDWSDFPSISADGRHVAFRSQANNLVGGDTNGTWDIFLRDTQTGTTTRLSVDSSGGQGNDWSISPSISADGRYVAFQSAASNLLVSGDTNGTRDVFIVPTSALFNLTVSKTGTGSGTVTSSPAGINCGATCSASFGYNTSVTLNATAVTGSTFTGWSGSDCSGPGTCTVTMEAARSVTANFTLKPYALSVSKTGTGSGTVTSAPAGIDCGATCSYSFDYNTAVTLTATPATGSTFTGWSGDGCSGTGTCTMTMEAAESVTANFNLNTNWIFLPLVIQ